MAAHAHSVYIPDDTWSALQVYLEETDMSASGFINKAILEKLEQWTPPPEIIQAAIIEAMSPIFAKVQQQQKLIEDMAQKLSDQEAHMITANTGKLTSSQREALAEHVLQTRQQIKEKV